jgi:hypothetical protein
MSEQVKPTNEEIAKYIFEWIIEFDRDGLIIEDEQYLKDALLHHKHFEDLREMFAPVMYDSIQEYVNKEK